MAKLIKCRTCGKPIAKDAKTCPHCGAKNKKKTPWVVYVICFFLISWFFGSIATRNTNDLPSNHSSKQTSKPENTEKVETPEDLLAFDEKTWEDFKKLYKAHNDVMKAMRMYSDGELDTLAFYNLCEEAEKYFGSASLALRYGETEYQQTYVSVLQSMALYDQLAVRSLMKYLDSSKVSDLNEAEDNISQAVHAVEVMASNRGVLLARAGLADNEILERVEADTTDMD